MTKKIYSLKVSCYHPYLQHIEMPYTIREISVLFCVSTYLQAWQSQTRVNEPIKPIKQIQLNENLVLKHQIWL
jgi:hypothetical protein